MRFDSPLFLLFLLLIPILIKSRSTINTPKPQGLSFSSRTDIRGLPKSLRNRLKQPILGFCFLAAYCLFVIALARPQTGSSYTETESSGRDIMLALDISGSMQALDFFIDSQRVDRLNALKYVVNKFVDGRAGDRMGLVVFADQAFTQCPLTLDHNVLKEYLKATQIGMAGQATAIGDALAIATKRIKDIEAESKVIVLVSDGKNNAGSVDPLEAAKIAATHKIKIHTIGIGSQGYAPFPVQTVFGSVRLVQRNLEFDEQTLKEIARLTGGQYFNAKDLSGLENIYKAIDSLEKREEQTFQYVEYEEHFLPVLLLGLVFLVLYEILAATIFQTIP